MHEVPDPQAFPHDPQLLLLVLVLTHAPLQTVCPDVQQTPPAQDPLAHTFPHEPQLFGSVVLVTHVPLQSDCPEGQLHVVPEHVPLLQGYEQSLLHTVSQVPMQFFCPFEQLLSIDS